MMPATSARIRLLIIEDDAIDRQEFTRFVSDRNLPYDVTVARNLSEARRHLAAAAFDVIFTDHQIIRRGRIFQAEFVLKARTAARFHGKPEPRIRPAFTRGDIGHLRGGAGGYAKLGGVWAAIRHGAYSFNHNIGSSGAASNHQRLRGPCGGCYSASSRDF
jgi:hypothetical protein